MREWEVTDVHAGAVGALRDSGSLLDTVNSNDSGSPSKSRRGSFVENPELSKRGRSSVGVRSSVSRHAANTHGAAEAPVDETSSTGNEKEMVENNRASQRDAIRAAKKYRLKIWEVKQCWDEFNELDEHGVGKLHQEQFLK